MKTGKKKLSVRDMALTALMAAVIAVCAWISFPLTVPITLQTFAIFVTGGLLGKKRGVAAVALYILLGAAGLPVFSGFNSGAGVVLGATGGYVVGFLFTAFIVGAASERWKGNTWALAASMVLGALVCYAFGTLWFMLVYARGTGGVGLSTALGMCVFPFLIPDAVKIAAAVFVVKRLGKAVKIAQST